jgi:hypothetical protein
MEKSICYARFIGLHQNRKEYKGKYRTSEYKKFKTNEQI